MTGSTGTRNDCNRAGDRSSVVRNDHKIAAGIRVNRVGDDQVGSHRPDVIERVFDHCIGAQRIGKPPLITEVSASGRDESHSSIHHKAR